MINEREMSKNNNCCKTNKAKTNKEGLSGCLGESKSGTEDWCYKKGFQEVSKINPLSCVTDR
jgi:hypothetical protein